MILRKIAVWLLLAFTVSSVIATFALPGDLDASQVVVVMFFLSATSAVGTLLASRMPEHPIGWLLLVASVCFAVGGLLVTYVELAALTKPEQFSLQPWMVLAGNWLFGIGVGLVSTFLLLLFPTGKLPSPRWKPVAVVAALALPIMLVGVSLSEETFEGLPVSNPFALDPSHPVVLITEGGGFYLFLAALLASVVSLFVRYRSGGYTERQQLRLVALAVVPVALAAAVPAVWELLNGTAEFSDDVENALITFSLGLVPVSIAVAILRYRLYEIDRIVSRTVSYALILALLGLVVLGLVSVFALFLPSDDPLVVAVSTLAAAALFNPLRRRVQGMVDRRFNRSRYDAERVIAGFAGTLRERVDPEAVVDGWVGVVSETMEPASVGVWVRDR
ncbi:MAG: hypothetical protein WD274_03445 [Acidimicrobiia bacterium]